MKNNIGNFKKSSEIRNLLRAFYHQLKDKNLYAHLVILSSTHSTLVNFWMQRTRVWIIHSYIFCTFTKVQLVLIPVWRRFTICSQLIVYLIPYFYFHSIHWITKRILWKINKGDEYDIRIWYCIFQRIVRSSVCRSSILFHLCVYWFFCHIQSPW